MKIRTICVNCEQVHSDKHLDMTLVQFKARFGCTSQGPSFIVGAQENGAPIFGLCLSWPRFAVKLARKFPFLRRFLK